MSKLNVLVGMMHIAIIGHFLEQTDAEYVCLFGHVIRLCSRYHKFQKKPYSNREVFPKDLNHHNNDVLHFFNKWFSGCRIYRRWSIAWQERSQNLNHLGFLNAGKSRKCTGTKAQDWGCSWEDNTRKARKNMAGDWLPIRPLESDH